MGTRRVYRGIEEAALLGNFTDCGCPHNLVSRRLRCLYRESRDLMQLHMSRVMASAAAYGNPKLDAVKGHKKIMQACDRIAGMINYFDKSRRAPSRATLDHRNVNTQVMLLNELRKNISKDVAIGEIEQAFGKIKNKEKHILGGAPATPTKGSEGMTNG